MFAAEYQASTEPHLADDARRGGSPRAEDAGLAARTIGRPRQRRIEDILAEAGVDAGRPAHTWRRAAYQRFWEPHTWTDPQVRPLWEGLRDNGIRVGVLSNTIWSRDYHRDVFARDGVLRPDRRATSTPARRRG